MAYLNGPREVAALVGLDDVFTRITRRKPVHVLDVVDLGAHLRSKERERGREKERERERERISSASEVGMQSQSTLCKLTQTLID